MDCSGRTFSHTFLAEFTFVEVDVSHIVLDCNSSERTYLCTFAASDAGSLAGFAGNSALVLVDTAYEDPHVPSAFVAEFDHALRACLCTCTASSTFFLVNNRKAGLRVHDNGPELTYAHAIPTTEASE